MKRKIASRLPCPARYRLEILEAADCGRKEVEQFIHSCYAFAYNADLKSFLPKIMSLRNEQGQISAALGYRKAGTDRLFLENYLKSPVENYLESISGSSVNREDIIEVGNLASASSGGNRLLITALSGLLQGKGAKWVVFTATPALLNSFSRMGLHPYALSLADKESVGKEVDDWGSYYEQAPVVVAGNVAQAYAALEKKLRLEQVNSQYSRLSQESYNVGLSQVSGHCC
jgi:hypothetical protein